MKNETITIKLNKRKIKRNVIIIIFLILTIKYIGFMNNYNKKVFAVYDDFVNYAELNELTVNQENYKNYSKTINK
jgi:hypothetical protein